MFDQISTYIENVLSPYLFGFQKGHSTEQCLIIMIESWKKANSNISAAGAVLTDLSKSRSINSKTRNLWLWEGSSQIYS